MSNFPDATSRLIHLSAEICFGLWECPPNSKLWTTENTIGPDPVIALPWTPVVIDRMHARSEMMDPNCVVFYAPGEPYARQIASVRGDRCGFISPSPQLLAEALEDAGLSAANDAPPFKTGPAVSWVTAAHHKLARALVDNMELPRIAIESILMDIVRQTVLAAATSRRRPPRINKTQRAHADIAHRAREIMAHSIDNHTLGASLRLNDLARQLHVSPFHLCRVFKQQTGESIAKHALRLRLRAATEQLAWSGKTITSIAHSFGFANHAHFTTAWKTEFGRPQSALRRQKLEDFLQARN